jgi:hypothetical protein
VITCADAVMTFPALPESLAYISQCSHPMSILFREPKMC